MSYDRHNEILRLLAQERRIEVHDLVLRLCVSKETIRRDLEHLEKHGNLRRIRGGAVARQLSGKEPEYSLREIKNYAEKHSVAAAAVNLVEDGNTLAIDIGTTCLEFAKLLKGKKKVTVITNAIPIAIELANDPGVRVILLGGNVRDGDYASSGFLAEEAVRNFIVDKYIMGVGGLTLDAGITDYVVEEANLRRHLLERSQATVAVTDNSKFGVVAMNRICDVSALHTLVTDQNADARMLAAIREKGVNVVLANTE
jgi:Transcriptional regulators of sugar metabolism